jgi:hypothetical protein
MAFGKDDVVLTATRLIQPIMNMMMPAEITTRHTENDHCKCQSNEAVGRTEKWPVAGEEGAEERELRGQKKHYVVCQQGALLLVVPRYLLLVIAVST